jgi:hypothetical protein
MFAFEAGTTYVGGGALECTDRNGARHQGFTVVNVRALEASPRCVATV